MPSTRYPRSSEQDDFGRVVSFTDAVFAIAMTLLVVEIGVPARIAGEVDDPAALLDTFADKGPLIFAFFLGCYVIGSFWVAHHRFMSWLAAVNPGVRRPDRGLPVVRGAAALPDRGAGRIRAEPDLGGRLALNRAAISGMETVLLGHARRRRLLLMFLASVPVAFVLPWLAIVMWFPAIPVGMLINRRQPAGATRYLTRWLWSRLDRGHPPAARPAGRC
jgi:Endosomal/lysosomal potassium channel TMEM175